MPEGTISVVVLVRRDIVEDRSVKKSDWAGEWDEGGKVGRGREI